MTKTDELAESSITPVPMELKLNSCALLIAASCGDCRHFDRMAHSRYGKVCSTLGVLKEAKPCTRFQPDTRRLGLSEDEDLIVFARTLAKVPTSKLKLVASVINREARTRKRGFAFGEVVYIHAFGGDYISNYRKCRVISVDSELAHLEGASKFVASVLPKSVLTAKQWKRKHKALTETKKLMDPKYKTYMEHQATLTKEIEAIRRTGEPPEAKKTNTRVSSTVLAIEKKKMKRFKPDISTIPLDQLIVRG